MRKVGSAKSNKEVKRKRDVDSFFKRRLED